MKKNSTKILEQFIYIYIIIIKYLIKYFILINI